MIDYCIEQMGKLMNIASPTGMTDECSAYVAEVLKDMGFSPVVSRKGTVLCELGGTGNGLLLSAHLDTLGAVVRAVKPNGRLRYSKLGGWNDNAVENENVTVHTRDGKKYSATIQNQHASVHVWGSNTAEKRDDSTQEVVIDEVTHSKQETEALGISSGDFISFDPRFTVTDSGFIKSRFLDDKASAAILLTLAKEVAEGNIRPVRKTVIVFTVYEEIGHGASELCKQHDIVDMVAIDMGCVGSDLSGDETKVSICAKDAAGPYDWSLTNELIARAKAVGADYAVDCYFSYSSDTATALKAGLEARFGLIGPGVAASHAYERTHKNGVNATLKIACDLVSREYNNETEA